MSHLQASPPTLAAIQKALRTRSSSRSPKSPQKGAPQTRGAPQADSCQGGGLNEGPLEAEEGPPEAAEGPSEAAAWGPPRGGGEASEEAEEGPPWGRGGGEYAVEELELLIDNSLYEMYLQGAGGREKRESCCCRWLLCRPCLGIGKEKHNKSRNLNLNAANSYYSNFNKYEIIGSCWLACSDSRLLIIPTENEEESSFNSKQVQHKNKQNKQKNKQNKQTDKANKQTDKENILHNKENKIHTETREEIANKIQNNNWEAKPEEVRRRRSVQTNLINLI